VIRKCEGSLLSPVDPKKMYTSQEHVQLAGSSITGKISLILQVPLEITSYDVTIFYTLFNSA
jgi:predicted aconitase with swiveling domain